MKWKLCRQPHFSEERQYQVVRTLQAPASIEEYLDVFNFVGARVQPEDKEDGTKQKR